MEECCKGLKGIFTLATSTGMVAVPSGVVTREDMDRADRAATESGSVIPEFFPKRKYYVLSDGTRVQNPEGMQSSMLDAVWWRAILDVDALDRMVEQMDEKH